MFNIVGVVLVQIAMLGLFAGCDGKLESRQKKVSQGNPSAPGSGGGSVFPGTEPGCEIRREEKSGFTPTGIASSCTVQSYVKPGVNCSEIHCAAEISPEVIEADSKFRESCTKAGGEPISCYTGCGPKSLCSVKI
jgi:hypothetical protein